MRLDSTRTLAPRRIVALGLAAALAVAWAIPGPIPALVARQDGILLGRYAVGHFAGLALATIAVALAIALLWSRRSLAESLALAALALLSTLAGVAAIGALARGTIAPRYEARPVASAVVDPALRARLSGRVLTRQPKFHWELVREDRPAPGRTYRNRAPGQPARRVVLTTDANGLRNPSACERCDVVVAGDSFTEGSMVSDGKTWWERVAAQTGLAIYNTAVSGLSVREYLNNWAAFGLDRAARTLVVVLYEGNDWKRLPPASASAAARVESRPPLRRAGFFDFLFGDSPLRARAELALVQLLAPIGAGWPPPPSVGLDWMPVAVEAGGAVHHYAFEPKHLMRLDWDPAAFAAAPEWTTNEAVLRELVAIARERGIRVVVAYAPSKPHVVMPLVRERVTPEQLHAFASFRDRGPALPDPEALAERLYGRLDVQQSVLAAWCAAQGVEFVPLTEPLRAAIAAGIPAYFTYDPHWTEQGHEVVARYLASRLAR